MTATHALDDRVTVGTSDTTMRIWLLVDAVGPGGLTRDEIIVAVAPHVNAGHARRRYLAHRRRRHKSDRMLGNGSPSIPAPEWDDTPLEPARSHVVRTAIRNMVTRGSLIRLPGDRLVTGRKPRYRRDESAIDISGDRTRIHFTKAEAIRTLKPALKRHANSTRASLKLEEWIALERLVAIVEHELRGPM